MASARTNWLWLAVAVSLAVSFTPWAPLILYPFKLFTTWIHECGHALMTVLVGGDVMSITIEPNTSGLTMSSIPDTRIARGLVTSAGYLGAAVVGCLLIAATRLERRAHLILLGIGAFMLFTLVVWMRNLFGAAVVLAWGSVLVLLARRGGMGNAQRFLLSLLAIQVALNALYDIRVLYLVRGESDAATMARLFALPAWFWATTWIVTSVAMLSATFYKTRRR